MEPPVTVRAVGHDAGRCGRGILTAGAGGGKNQIPVSLMPLKNVDPLPLQIHPDQVIRAALVPL